MVTVVTSEDARPRGESIVGPFAAQPLPPPPAAAAARYPTPVVLIKGDARLADVISEYAEASRADLVVCGSHHLCVQGARVATKAARHQLYALAVG